MERRMRRRIGCCAAKRTVASRIRAGTIRANARAGVRSRSQAPSAPPTKEGTTSKRAIVLVRPSSRRKPIALASDPGTSATALLAFATIGSRPSHSKVGNDSSVPPPAIAFIAPATSAARNIAVVSSAPIVAAALYQRDRGTTTALQRCGPCGRGRTTGHDRPPAADRGRGLLLHGPGTRVSTLEGTAVRRGARTRTGVSPADPPPHRRVLHPRRGDPRRRYAPGLDRHHRRARAACPGAVGLPARPHPAPGGVAARDLRGRVARAAGHALPLVVRREPRVPDAGVRRHAASGGAGR